jgi:hypothetical protein
MSDLKAKLFEYIDKNLSPDMKLRIKNNDMEQAISEILSHVVDFIAHGSENVDSDFIKELKKI